MNANASASADANGKMVRRVTSTHLTLLLPTPSSSRALGHRTRTCARGCGRERLRAAPWHAAAALAPRPPRNLATSMSPGCRQRMGCTVAVAVPPHLFSAGFSRLQGLRGCSLCRRIRLCPERGFSCTAIELHGISSCTAILLHNPSYIQLHRLQVAAVAQLFVKFVFCFLSIS